MDAKGNGSPFLSEITPLIWLEKHVNGIKKNKKRIIMYLIKAIFFLDEFKKSRL